MLFKRSRSSAAEISPLLVTNVSLIVPNYRVSYTFTGHKHHSYKELNSLISKDSIYYHPFSNKQTKASPEVTLEMAKEVYPVYYWDNEDEEAPKQPPKQFK
jgi:hypothetical protein